MSVGQRSHRPDRDQELAALPASFSRTGRAPDNSRRVPVVENDPAPGNYRQDRANDPVRASDPVWENDLVRVRDPEWASGLGRADPGTAPVPVNGRATDLSLVNVLKAAVRIRLVIGSSGIRIG